MKGRAKRRRILLGLFIVAALYLLWLGILLLRFKPSRQEIPSLRRAPREVEGVYHVHTKFSDGQQSAEKIAQLAARQSLNFIILTDHGNPNVPSLASQGWRDGLLVLAGSELSTSRGHLVALGFAPPSEPFPQNADLAIRNIMAWGGFSVVAHPYSKVLWSWGETAEFSGLEIIDSDTMVKRNFFRALPYFPSLLVNPRFYILKTIERPEQTLKKWDELAAGQSFYGYFSADAHILYRTLLSCFRLHVLLDDPLSKEFETARDQVFGTLRQGRFFNAIDAAGSARGFLFWAKSRRAKFPMGSTIPFKSTSRLRLRARARFPFPIEIRLIHNGQTVFRRQNRRHLSFLAKQPGTYRVEVYLKQWSPLAKDIPWIVSNPIFLREDEK